MKEDVAIVRLAGGKANAMTRALLEDLIGTFARLGTTGARAAVVTGYASFFSAGLALPDLVALERPAMREFIGVFHNAMVSVFRCPLPIVGAINGHAIAGGCVLALQTDWRVMADVDAKIGLNEVLLGIGLPSVVIEPLRLAAGSRALTTLALEGKLTSPREALALGLVDEVVPAAELEARAIAKASALAVGSPLALLQIKNALRRPAQERMDEDAAAETERWLDTWFSEPAQKRLQQVVARLRSGS
jgi:enoyl-CoA hydratase